ncbi:gamma-glutamyltransferase [Streptomyces fuscichromogenes]|uniref:Gamma-glutamyltranspeptidase n=1 Tax=Streptomyces fuscichromogenes TaxID=1324013 RepID=A0A917XG84_9ACTN|nr:gamma-glutamyltransferase [Streptomyces fuscichromogenes]GGN22673.1 gamma-glutamyltranspeptidase [Streptomyces fuscichromogenes]
MNTDRRQAWMIGPKEPVTGESAVASSQSPLVTDVVLETMRKGGNAIDAGIAGCLVQAGTQQHLTNHAGTVTLLYYEAATGETHELNSWGTVVQGLAPFRRLPGRVAEPIASPVAAIPGYIPGLGAMHERFGTMAWSELCQPAIHWAEEGHYVTPFESFWLQSDYVDMYLYTESGREHFAPGGLTPALGERFRKPALATTMRRLAEEGPEHFTTGGWAEDFVKRGNDLGWNVKLEHMKQIAPRWGKGLRYTFRDNEIVQLSSPEVAGVFSAMTLGILDKLDVEPLGHFTESPEALAYLALTLRWVEQQMSFLKDPLIFEDAAETLMSADFHQHGADLIRRSRPKIDLTEHMLISHGRAAVAAAGASSWREVSLGTAAISIVDGQGNWAQITHTSQGGGIPGEVVNGVSMRGYNTTQRINSMLETWFTGGARGRAIVGNTFVMRDGEPIWQLGMPSRPQMFMPQILANRLIWGMDHYTAEDTPRLYQGVTDDYRVLAEARFPGSVVAGLVKKGMLLDPLKPYTVNVGSTQMAWRGDDGRLHAVTTPRDEGAAGGF